VLTQHRAEIRQYQTSDLEMPTIEGEARLTISVLDRLLDYEPNTSREAKPSRLQNLRQLKDAVRRDLEWLLNTRQVANLSPHLKEVNSSVAAFGLPDFTELNAEKADDQKEMRRRIEETIRLFEPRLGSVVVTFQPSDSTERVMRFRINAHLQIDPEPEPITFDTMVQIGRGQYVVREE
jgi:type VI secretion system protein ImpF